MQLKQKRKNVVEFCVAVKALKAGLNFDQIETCGKYAADYYETHDCSTAKAVEVGMQEISKFSALNIITRLTVKI